MSSALQSLTAWREQVGRSLFALDFEPSGDGPFRAEVMPILSSGGVQILRWRHTPGFTFRDRTLVKDGLSSCALVIPEHRSIDYAHRRSEGRLRTGDATLLSMAEPGSIGSPGVSSYLAVVVPDGAGIAAGHGEALIGQTWPRTLPALCLLRGYIRALAGLPTQQSLTQLVARHVTDLLSLAARERLGLDKASQRATVEDQRTLVALDFIARNFRDPTLAEPAVAASQGISTRYLQRLLEKSGLSFTDHVNSLRLDAARKALVEPKLDHLRIADIALECGFSDISHFNRRFRRRFGETPSAMRNGRRR